MNPLQFFFDLAAGDLCAGAVVESAAVCIILGLFAFVSGSDFQ